MEKIYWDGFFARFAIQAILYQGKNYQKIIYLQSRVAAGYYIDIIVLKSV